MRSVDPKMRALARRLLAIEGSSGKAGSAVFGVFERLRKPFVELAGVAGFRSLASRALALASDEVQWLIVVQVDRDGSLRGLDEAHVTDAEIGNGEATLVARLLGLLVTFVGETLTLHLLQSAWPEASLASLEPEPKREP